MILLTGATGRVGSAAARALLRAQIPFRVLVRDPGKLGVDGEMMEVFEGDLGDPRSVERALEGISRALIVMAVSLAFRNAEIGFPALVRKRFL